MESASEQKIRITALFSQIAESYDAANDRISFGLHRVWKEKLCREAGKTLTEGGAVLDICCGTGDLTLRLAKHCPGAEIVGIDLTPKMIEVALRRKAAGQNVRFQQGDAMALPFPDSTFDLVTTAFGLRNTPDIAQVLREMQRVTKPGGQVFILESSVPENGIIRFGFRLYFSLIMPIWGGGRKHLEEYRWLNQSTWSFPGKAELTDKMADAGLRENRYCPLLFGSAAIHTGTKP